MTYYYHTYKKVSVTYLVYSVQLSPRIRWRATEQQVTSLRLFCVGKKNLTPCCQNLARLGPNNRHFFLSKESLRTDSSTTKMTV